MDKILEEYLMKTKNVEMFNNLVKALLKTIGFEVEGRCNFSDSEIIKIKKVCSDVIVSEGILISGKSILNDFEQRLMVINEYSACFFYGKYFVELNDFISDKNYDDYISGPEGYQGKELKTYVEKGNSTNPFLVDLDRIYYLDEVVGYLVVSNPSRISMEEVIVTKNYELAKKVYFEEIQKLGGV